MAERGTGTAGEYETRVIRLFPDYAGTVIWFSGPVPYEQTHLDAPLIADLEAWEASYYDGLTPELSWRSAGQKVQFDATGARLARRLADQVGDDFQVQHDHGGSHRRVRGAGPARNPAAAAAFSRLAEDAREEAARLGRVVQRAAKEGHTLEWRAD